MKSTQASLGYILILLASLTALGPLAIDAYLPAIPTMATYFSRSIHDVELSLSIFLAGYSVGQLLGGPFSDHFGRRRTIFIGLLIFAVGTLGIILSTSLTGLLIFRFIEALGGGIAIVNSGAIIRDISSGRDNATNMAHMALIMMLAPLLAPMIGSTILHFTNWYSIFIFLFLYTLVIAFLINRHIPETRQASTEKTNALQRYLEVLTHRPSLGYIFSFCFGFSGMFTFITASPSVYMGYFGVSENIFPFLFGANIIAMIAANRLNVVLLKYHPPDKLITLGQLIQIICALTLVTYILSFSTLYLPVVVVLIMLFVGSQSFIMSNANSSTLEFFPNSSGTASALLGACGAATAGLAGTVVGLTGDGTPLPMALIMTGTVVCGISLRFMMQRGSNT